MDTLRSLRAWCCALPWYVRFAASLAVLIVGGDVAVRFISGPGIADSVVRFAIIIVPWLAVYWLCSRPGTLSLR